MTPPSPSIAGLIAELREQTEVMLDMAHRGECDSFNGKLMRRAADALEKQTTDLAAAKGALERADRWIELHPPKYGGDHACAQCYPFSDILLPNFVCAYHASLARARALQPKVETP